jgi:hypothetical protein
MTVSAIRRLACSLTSALALTTALVGAGVAHATTSDTPTSSVHLSTPRVLADCLTASRRPPAITLTCADGNAMLKRAPWRWWGQRSAGGSATFVANDCKPNCAAGHFHWYPVTDWLNRPVHGMFSRLTVHLDHPVKSMKRTLTFQLATRSV